MKARHKRARRAIRKRNRGVRAWVDGMEAFASFAPELNRVDALDMVGRLVTCGMLTVGQVVALGLRRPIPPRRVAP